ncbi:MAG: FliI/YscN family ATPase [Rhodocyclaceae bacterium]
MKPYIEAVKAGSFVRRIGYVRELTGLAIRASGPMAAVGDTCRITARDGRTILTEVVGVGVGEITLMPFGATAGLSVGAEVCATGDLADFPVGDALLGRVIDGFGSPVDGLPPIACEERRPLRGQGINPMKRPRIHSVQETGVRAIDTLLTLGQGQRIGIFAGSGVGKSTLLGMIARHVVADVNVIALIGERGREVREFVEKHLGDEGLARSVVVVATADQPALARIRAAYAAITIAEHFRSQGRQVMLTMDSVTRLAMARREVGLAAGEPPTARGYTPSVFAEIPELCERCGLTDDGGITALLTVLVEGDDLNEPIADCLRATLDGHIVLSRDIAHRGQFPAIDILKSSSRLMADVASPEERALATRTVRAIAALDKNRQLVDIGAYVAGTNKDLDRALSIEEALGGFLAQSAGGAPRRAALEQLARLHGGGK